MTAITRRGAMLGASAAVAMATVAAPAVQADDTVLLARAEQFHEVYEVQSRMWEKAQTHRAAVEAMPDCPEPPGYPTRGDFRAHDAFLKAHDADRYCDEANELDHQMGVAAKAIFETPAMTWRGAVEKFKIAHLAIGSYADDGDEGLEAYQDWEKPWMATVAADFERLIGGMRL